MHDLVVASIGKVLLKAGYIVGTFNFRYFSQKQHYKNFNNERWRLSGLRF